MVDAKWGKRYTCFKCDTRFYDLNKPDAVCPKCEANQSKAPQKGVLSAAAKARRKLMPVEESSEEDDTKAETDRLDIDPLEDTSPLKVEI